MNTLIKLMFLVLWFPGAVIAFPLRIIYQGIIIGKETADSLLEKTR